MSDAEVLDAFRSLFRGRSEIWGSVEGKSNKETVTEAHYQLHLEGKRSLGVYPLLDDGYCHFAAVDLDEKDFEKAVKVRNGLKDLGIAAYIAESKSKGYHVYVFAETRFLAKDIRWVLHSMLQKIKVSAEIFPKQDKLDEVIKFGNYINLPYFGMNSRQFLTTSNVKLSLETAHSRIVRVPEVAVEEAVANLPQELPQMMPHKIPKIKQGTPIPETKRNASLASIAGAMRRKGADQSAIEAALLEINARQCQPPLSEREVLKIAGSVSRYEPKPDTEQPAHFNLTDYGCAERLVSLYGDVIRYSPERKAWLIWTGKVWEWDMGGVRIAKLAKKTARNIYREAADEPDDDLRKELVKHARATERQVRLDAMIKSAESEPGVAVSLADLDANHWLLNVNNGTIDLKTGELKPHDRADLITEILPIDYVTGTTSTEWDTFLHRIFNGNTDLIAYIQRALGYSITGDQSEQAFFFCYGNGFNGKSTLLNACRLVAGNYATEVPPTAFMVDKFKRGGPDEAIANLKNKRLVCSTELEDGQRLSVSLVKRMTGGEPLWCEHKFERGYNFQPTHKLWLSGNHEPVITDTTNSIWYRLKKIPFTIEIPEADRKKGYADYLASEYSTAILAWLVRGCVEWRQTGTLGEPEAVKQAVAEYRDQQDILHDYLIERCIFQKAATIDQKALYADYKQWAEGNDQNAIGKLTFRSRILEKGASTAIGNRNIKVWRGIRLRTDSDDVVTSITSVTDFSESLLHEASTGKTLLKNDNKSNKNNTDKTGELPDCPACGRNEWTYSADGELLCPCGYRMKG